MDDIGEKIVESLQAYFMLPENVQMIEDMTAFGLSFEAEKTIHEWVQERNEFAPLLQSIISKDHLMDLESQSPECKMLSQQLVVLAKMLNLTNKNVI